MKAGRSPMLESLMVYLLLLPLAAALLIFLFGKEQWILPLSSLGIFGILIPLGKELYLGGELLHSIGAWGSAEGISFKLDGLSFILIALTAIVSSLIGFYALAYFKKKPNRYFWAVWFFLWASLTAMFLSNDLFNIYVTLELVTLSAVGLITFSGKKAAYEAAIRYLLFSLIASFFYLLGVAFVYSEYKVLNLDLLSLSFSLSPLSILAASFISVGLLLKAALFPFHFWLPPAHSNAPAPVSAVLSGLVVKGAIYLLFRLHFEVFDFSETALFDAIGVAAVFAILFGSTMALYQKRLKGLIAYSSVAQIGYIFLVFPLSKSSSLELVLPGALLILMSHAFSKSALFLTSGIYMHFMKNDELSSVQAVAKKPYFFFPLFLLAAYTIIGFPPSGTFVGKWIFLQNALSSGNFIYAVVILMGSFLAAGYIYKVYSLSFTVNEQYNNDDKAIGLPMIISIFVLALLGLVMGISNFWLPQFIG